jgi:hypothetical protein
VCVDVPALNTEYAKHKRATSIDYTAVLQWVVTDNANGQSNLAKPDTYSEPLPLASKAAGRFVRLARLWEAAPDQSIDNYEAEDIAEGILLEHGVPEGERAKQKRALGALIMVLRDVKQTRVTFLELSQYEEAHGDRDVYYDAIVNIFTRLNTAGRTLTREDITFAWLKIGWNTEATDNKSAKACIDELTQQLNDLALPVGVEDVISGITFVWSTSFNGGKLLTNNDLMRGDAIRPMAANVSKNWHLVVDAAIRISAHAKDRGLRFREHYQSVNALSYLWAWYFIALHWGSQRKLIVDTSKPRSLSPTGEVALTFARAAAFCGDTEITDPVEHNIAWIFMQFGEWVCSEQAILSGNEVDAIEMVWTPRERTNEGQNFEMIGTLSSMFSRYYAAHTLEDAGVIQTEAKLIPDWFAPLVASSHKSIALPLWRFIIEPNRTPRKETHST